jgi:hypothetical protein
MKLFKWTAFNSIEAHGDGAVGSASPPRGGYAQAFGLSIFVKVSLKSQQNTLIFLIP